MTDKDEETDGRVTDNPLIGEGKPIALKGASIIWSSIFGISILSPLCMLLPGLRKALTALSIHHTLGIRIAITTGTMEHEGSDQLKQSWMGVRIRKLSR